MWGQYFGHLSMLYGFFIFIKLCSKAYFFKFVLVVDDFF